MGECSPRVDSAAEREAENVSYTARTIEWMHDREARGRCVALMHTRRTPGAVSLPHSSFPLTV